MARRATINLIISAIIVCVFFYVGYLNVKDKDHSEWGYFFIFLFAGSYSIIIGIVTTIISLQTKRHRYSILFITSCLTNMIVTYIPIMWLTTGANGVSSLLLVIFSLPPLIFITQIALILQGAKE